MKTTNVECLNDMAWGGAYSFKGQETIVWREIQFMGDFMFAGPEK